MKAIVSWLCALLVAVASCSAEHPSPEPTPTEVSCDDSVGKNVDVPENYESILETVALPTAESSQSAIQAVARDDIRPGFYFAKTGLLVRAGSGVTLRLEGSTTSGGMSWGAPGDFSPSLRVPPCEGQGWLAFAGGFLVSPPACLDVLVRTTDGQEERVSIGAGQPCEGQRPV